MLNFRSSYIIGNMDLHCVKLRSMRLNRTKKDGEGNTVVKKTIVKALAVAGVRLHGQSMFTISCLPFTLVIFPVSVNRICFSFKIM